MGISLSGVNVMGIVSSEQRCVDRVCDRDQVGQYPSLCFEIVIVQFDEEVVTAKYILIGSRHGDCRFKIPLMTCVPLLAVGVRSQQLRHLPAEAARGGNNPL